MVHGDPAEDLSNKLVSIQQLVQDFEEVRSSLDALETLLAACVEKLEENTLKILETSTSGASQNFQENDLLSQNSEDIEEEFLATTSHFKKLIRIGERPDLHNLSQCANNFESDLLDHPAIKKISLFLIHEDIYTLTTLISHYTRFEYFMVYPFFSVSQLLSEIHPETDGVILISSGIIKEDPTRVLMNLREHTQLMPIIVIYEEEEAACEYTYIEIGYNGIIREKCQISEFLNKFLTGLRKQIIIDSVNPGE